MKKSREERKAKRMSKRQSRGGSPLGSPGSAPDFQLENDFNELLMKLKIPPVAQAKMKAELTPVRKESMRLFLFSYLL